MDDWEIRRAIKDAKRLVVDQLVNAHPGPDDFDWFATKVVHLLLDAGWSPTQ